MKLKNLLVTGTLLLGASGVRAETLDIVKINETIKEIIKDVVSPEDDKISSLNFEFSPSGTDIENGKVQGNISSGLHYTPWSQEKNQAFAINFKAHLVPQTEQGGYLGNGALSLAARTPTLDLMKHLAKEGLEGIGAEGPANDIERRAKEALEKLSVAKTFDEAARLVKALFDLALEENPQEEWTLNLEENEGLVTKITAKLVFADTGEYGTITVLVTIDPKKIEGGVKVQGAKVAQELGDEIQKTLKDFLLGIQQQSSEVIESIKEIAKGFIEMVKVLLYQEA